MEGSVQYESFRGDARKAHSDLNFFVETTPLDEDSYGTLQEALSTLWRLVQHGSTEWEEY